MKYFTPELYIRGNSTDETTLRGIEAEWERVLSRYERRQAKIKSALPAGVRRFEKAHLCLHDAEVLHLAQEREHFVVVLRREPPSSDLVILTFTLVQDPVVRTDVLPEALRTERTFWLYEEFDIDRRKRCSVEILFSNGWLIHLRFRDLRFLVAQTVFPPSDGQAAVVNGKPVPRSA